MGQRARARFVPKYQSSGKLKSQSKPRPQADCPRRRQAFVNSAYRYYPTFYFGAWSLYVRSSHVFGTGTMQMFIERLSLESIAD